MIDSKVIIRAVLEDLGRQELARVKPLIGSKTLRAAITLIISETEARAELFIPHYWAIWYHDGRGAVSPTSARKLVFFDNPSDDPRLRGGRPVRESQVRRLTRSQYRAGLQMNRDRAAAGRRPFMFVVDRVGPSAPRPFFRQLEAGSVGRADQVVPIAFERELLRQIEADPDTRPETQEFGFDLSL